ncbi:DNA-directed RNA polymerase subunit [Mycena chlorophos]|uniref:DNA-directed RNA polymerase subunit n=1 Tax=Mycena chlorophos TaxID=658473 RepID=A0A8H6TFA8_MYCCL|nr:DNA-directed RNA polymerase subunit [Mycena chlorophos]
MPHPFPLIPQPPGDWKDVFDNFPIEMAIAHNIFIRGINAIYAQVGEIQGDQVKPFTFFCSCFFSMLHHHHHLEETLIFPILESHMGENAMGHNVEQHHGFMDGLKDLEEYLTAIQEEKASFGASTVLEKLDSFSELLVEHLREVSFESLFEDPAEIEPQEMNTIETSKIRAALTEKDLHDMNAQISAVSMKELSLTTTLPMVLLCNDKAMAPHFPPLPAPALWLAKYVLYYLHRDAWVFAPCDINGVLKPGLGNDTLHE